MRSIRTKTTVLTVCAIIIAMTVATLMGVGAVKRVGTSSSEQILKLLCETGEKNLDAYFESVEQSVKMVSSFIETDLRDVRDLDDTTLGEHLQRATDICEGVSDQTNGILTYYYRIDPEFSKTQKGFWFVNLDGKGFSEHEPTDISKYDTNDTSQLVWFTVPKATGESIWLPPYITDNLDARVISYNVPIYWHNRFVGVFGIEMDYSTMAEQVDSIRLYDSGFAFINDEEGNIIYHPNIDVTSLTEETKPKVPDGLMSEDAFIRYSFEGVKKEAVWMPLSNGMRLNVTVPVAEINADWIHLIWRIILVSVILLVIFILFTMRFAGHITRPLQELTEVAKQVDEGDYDVELEYDGDDEVGILTRTVKQLVTHLKTYISDLNDLAYADALTSVHNKGAFDISIRDLQVRMDESEEPVEFGIGVLDCDDLKQINDREGHDKGDIYLQTACRMICRVFRHSPVFRIGGDEFAVILQDEDYKRRKELEQIFRDRCLENNAATEVPWEQVHAAIGIAVYDANADESVGDVVRRADALMYEDKRMRKLHRFDPK